MERTAKKSAQNTILAQRKSQQPRMVTGFSMAERVGFEPTEPCGSTDFEFCAAWAERDKPGLKQAVLSARFGRRGAVSRGVLRGQNAKNRVGTSEAETPGFGPKKSPFLEKCKNRRKTGGQKTASPANRSDRLRRYPLARMREKDPKNKKSSKP